MIFEELKTQIRRGETHEPFAGAELYYSGSRSREEIVSITGRLNKDVNIVVSKVYVHTHFYIPPIVQDKHKEYKSILNSIHFLIIKEIEPEFCWETHNVLIIRPISTNYFIIR